MPSVSSRRKHRVRQKKKRKQINLIAELSRYIISEVVQNIVLPFVSHPWKSNEYALYWEPKNYSGFQFVIIHGIVPVAAYARVREVQVCTNCHSAVYCQSRIVKTSALLPFPQASYFQSLYGYCYLTFESNQILGYYGNERSKPLLQKKIHDDMHCSEPFTTLMNTGCVDFHSFFKVIMDLFPTRSLDTFDIRKVNEAWLCSLELTNFFAYFADIGRIISLYVSEI